jgi:hypothetical protein
VLTELRGGLILRADAIALAIDLDLRGVRLSVKDGVLLAAPGSLLTATDRVQIAALKRHLMAFVGYCADVS